MKKPLVNSNYILHKYPGKGGWVYALIDKFPKNENGKFGSVKVKGTIDNYEINQYTLFPWKNKGMFLPVKLEIRRKIGKKEGDTVKIVLFKDDTEYIIPDELILCLLEEPQAYSFFISLTKSEQRLYAIWIFSAKRVETRANRIAKSIERLIKGKKLYEKDEYEK